MDSIGAKMTKINGLKPGDLTKWETDFMSSINLNVENRGGDTTSLSDRQVMVIENIYKKHFGG